jgi:hypothetical protein
MEPGMPPTPMFHKIRVNLVVCYFLTCYNGSIEIRENGSTVQGGMVVSIPIRIVVSYDFTILS